MEKQEITFYKEFWRYCSHSGAHSGEYVYMVGEQQGSYGERVNLMSQSAEGIFTSRPHSQNDLHSSICSLIKRERVNPETANEEDRKAMDEITKDYTAGDEREVKEARALQQKEEEFNSMPGEFRQGIEKMSVSIGELYEDSQMHDHRQIALHAAAAFGICQIKFTGYYQDYAEIAEDTECVCDTVIESGQPMSEMIHLLVLDLLRAQADNPPQLMKCIFIRADRVIGRVYLPLDIPLQWFCDYTKFDFVNIIIAKKEGRR